MLTYIDVKTNQYTWWMKIHRCYLFCFVYFVCICISHFNQSKFWCTINTPSHQKKLLSDCIALLLETLWAQIADKLYIVHCIQYVFILSRELAVTVVRHVIREHIHMYFISSIGMTSVVGFFFWLGTIGLRAIYIMKSVLLKTSMF